MATGAESPDKGENQAVSSPGKVPGDGQKGSPIEKQQELKQKDATTAFSAEAAQMLKEGSANRTANDAVAQSHPQLAKVSSFDATNAKGEPIKFQAIQNPDTGKTQYVGFGNDEKAQKYESDGKNLYRLDKDNKRTDDPPIALPPSHNTRGSEQEDRKPSAPEKSTQQGATLNRESNATGEARALAKSQDQSQVKAEALTGSPKSSDKQTIDSKQFSPVPQNDRSADQRGAAKSTNNESSRKGTEGGAPRSEGAGNDTTLKSITGPKVNSEAGASENRNRSVSPNEQSAAKSNLTELGVYKKFEGDKIDNRAGTDKAAKPEQPPQSQEGRLRRDLMEQNNQGKDPGRRDVLDQNSSRGNSAEAKNTGIPIPARTAENAGGRGSGGAGGASNSSEANTGKPIVRSTEGTKGGDGVGGGSSRRGDFDDRKSDGKNVRADGKNDRADEKIVKAEGKNDRPVRDSEGAKSQDSKPGDGKDGRSNSKGESDNRHDGGKNQDDRNESNKGKKQESKIDDRDSGKGNRPDRTEPIGAGRRDGKNDSEKAGVSRAQGFAA